jgi:hypothetical protein
MSVKLELTHRELRALRNTIEMVLSIQGSIRAGDKDYGPLSRVDQKVRRLFVELPKSSQSTALGDVPKEFDWL